MCASKCQSLSEESVNIIENLAYQTAEYCNGRITPHHLLPFMPVSLDIINDCLEEMVDGNAVIADKEGGIFVYEFPACRRDSVEESPKGFTRLTKDQVTALTRQVREAPGYAAFLKECSKLAEMTGWPARAVYEHEFCHLASTLDGAIHAENLAGRSRYTLRQTRKKLAQMCLDGYLLEKLDQSNGAITYYFPEITYPRSLYDENRKVIQTYPSSVMEEVEVKVIRVLFALTGLLIALFILAFLHMPFPLLILMFLVLAPLLTILIWRHREKPEE